MRFAQFIHSLVSWILATLCVCAALAAIYYYHRGDEELRRYLEQTIARRYPEVPLKIGSARLIHGEGIRLREVSILPTAGRAGTRTELAYCDEVILYCNPELQDLLQGNVVVQRVLLRRPHWKPSRDTSGTWNFADLLTLPDSSSAVTIPTVEIEGGQIELRDALGTQTTHMTLPDVNASISPSVDQPGKLKIHASLGSQFFQTAQFEVTADPMQWGSWSATGHVENLQCNQTLQQFLAMRQASLPPMLDGLQAVAQVRFSAAQGQHEPQPRFDIQATIENGRFEAPRFLAHSITDISIPNLRLVQDGQQQQWVLQDVEANYGASRIQMTVSGPQLDWNSDVYVDVAVQDLNLTRELIGILPAKQQALWAKYQPLGLLDLKAKSIRRAGQWRTNAHAQCKDVDIECEKFRYPLSRCQGWLVFRQGQDLKADLWAAPNRSWPSNPIHISANVQDPGPRFTGEIQVSMRPDAWLPIDARIRQATPPTVRKVLDDLDAHGEINVQTVLRRTDPEQLPLQKQSIIQVRSGSLKYDRFPYPLQNVSGTLSLVDGDWTFQEFQGVNDSCTVTCEGSWKAASNERPSELTLNLNARNIACDAELRDALPEGPRRIWSDLRPAGFLDHATIELRHRSGMEKSEIAVVVRQLNDVESPDGRRLEMKPTWFPLAMDRVTGEFRFLPNGEFSLQNIQAEHGSFQRTVKLRTEGRGIFREDNSWEILLDRVIADRVQTTPEFIASLPSNLGDAMKSLRFQGTLFVDAKDVHFTASADRLEPIRAAWSSTINVDDGQFVLAGKSVKNIFGEVTMNGRRQAAWVNYGNARFATCNCQGVHLTNLEIPWYLDSERLVFGDSVRVEGRATRSATGELFGGVVQGTGQVAFDKDNNFGMNLSLVNFDVGHRDLRLPAKISGRGDASLVLHGNAQGPHSLRGQGAMRVREANLAKLPTIIQVLNTMRISRSRSDVFTDANLNFQIDGPTAYFGNLDLHGESLTLKGQGRIELDQRVFLKFYSLLGGEKMYSKWMRPFAKETSERLLQIFVTGTLGDMKVSQEMGPGWTEFFPNQGVAGANRDAAPR